VQTRTIESSDAPKAMGGYAQAVEVTGARTLLFVSGQIPVDRDGGVPPDFASQCRLAWANVAAQLAAAGMGLDNLVKVTIFLADRAHAMENREVRKAVLGERKLAMTVIITGIFDPGWLLEIEAVAAS
jgi:2-iminobutanoate/2-iminopropanoate deaminase